MITSVTSIFLASTILSTFSEQIDVQTFCNSAAATHRKKYGRTLFQRCSIIAGINVTTATVLRPSGRLTDQAISGDTIWLLADSEWGSYLAFLASGDNYRRHGKVVLFHHPSGLSTQELRDLIEHFHYESYMDSKVNIRSRLSKNSKFERNHESVSDENDESSGSVPVNSDHFPSKENYKCFVRDREQSPPFIDSPDEQEGIGFGVVSTIDDQIRTKEPNVYSDEDYDDGNGSDSFEDDLRLQTMVCADDESSLHFSPRYAAVMDSTKSLLLSHMAQRARFSVGLSLGLSALRRERGDSASASYPLTRGLREEQDEVIATMGAEPNPVLSNDTFEGALSIYSDCGLGAQSLVPFDDGLHKPRKIRFADECEQDLTVDIEFTSVVECSDYDSSHEVDDNQSRIDSMAIDERDSIDDQDKEQGHELELGHESPRILLDLDSDLVLDLSENERDPNHDQKVIASIDDMLCAWRTVPSRSIEILHQQQNHFKPVYSGSFPIFAASGLPPTPRPPTTPSMSLFSRLSFTSAVITRSELPVLPRVVLCSQSFEGQGHPPQPPPLISRIIPRRVFSWNCYCAVDCLPTPLDIVVPLTGDVRYGMKMAWCISSVMWMAAVDFVLLIEIPGVVLHQNHTSVENISRFRSLDFVGTHCISTFIPEEFFVAPNACPVFVTAPVETVVVVGKCREVSCHVLSEPSPASGSPPLPIVVPCSQESRYVTCQQTYKVACTKVCTKEYFPNSGEPPRSLIAMKKVINSRRRKTGKLIVPVRVANASSYPLVFPAANLIPISKPSLIHPTFITGSLSIEEDLAPSLSATRDSADGTRLVTESNWHESKQILRTLSHHNIFKNKLRESTDIEGFEATLDNVRDRMFRTESEDIWAPDHLETSGVSDFQPSLFVDVGSPALVTPSRGLQKSTSTRRGSMIQLSNMPTIVNTQNPAVPVEITLTDSIPVPISSFELYFGPFLRMVQTHTTGVHYSLLSLDSLDSILWSAFQLYGKSESVIALSIRYNQAIKLLKEAKLMEIGKVTSTQLDLIVRQLPQSPGKPSKLLKQPSIPLTSLAQPSRMLKTGSDSGSVTSTKSKTPGKSVPGLASKPKGISLSTSIENGSSSNPSLTFESFRVMFCGLATAMDTNNKAKKQTESTSTREALLRQLRRFLTEVADKHAATYRLKYSLIYQESKIGISGVDRMLRPVVGNCNLSDCADTISTLSNDSDSSSVIHAKVVLSGSRSSPASPIKEPLSVRVGSMAISEANVLEVKRLWALNTDQLRQAFNAYASVHEVSRTSNIVFNGGSLLKSLMSFDNCRDLLSDFDILPRFIDIQALLRVFRSTKLWEWHLVDVMNNCPPSVMLDLSDGVSVETRRAWLLELDSSLELSSSTGHMSLSFGGFVEFLTRVACYGGKLGPTPSSCVESLLRIMNASNGRAKKASASRKSSLDIRVFVCSA